MINVSERTIGRLPHSNKQLARGTIGLLVGSIVAFLTGLMIYLMSAPLWMNAILGALALVAGAVAVLAPGWYWIVQPVFRGSGESAE